MVKKADTTPVTTHDADATAQSAHNPTDSTPHTPNADRIAALKALLHKHVNESAPPEVIERVAALKALLQKHVEANARDAEYAQAPHTIQTDNTDAEGNLLDLSRYVPEGDGILSVILKISNPDAGNLVPPQQTGVSSLHNEAGALVLHGTAENIHSSLTQLRIIPGQQPQSLRLEMQINSESQSKHHVVPLLFGESGVYIRLDPVEELRSFGRAQLPDLQFESFLQAEHLFGDYVSLHRYAHDAPLFLSPLQQGTNLSTPYGLDSIEIGTSSGFRPPIIQVPGNNHIPNDNGTGTNIAPRAMPDNFSFLAGSGYAFALTNNAGTGLLDNDFDLDGDTVTFFSIKSQTSAGGLIVHTGGGQYQYTPPSAGFVGLDTGSYTITDGQGNYSTGVIRFKTTGAVVLTPSPLDHLIGGTDFSGIAADWASTDTLEGLGSHSLTITSGLVNVDLDVYNLVSGIRLFDFQGDAAHNFVVTAGYLSRTALNGTLEIRTDATSFGVNFDASAAGAAQDVSLTGGDAADTLLSGAGNDTLTGGTDDTMDGGSGEDIAVFTSGTLAITLDGAASINAIETLDLTGSDAPHNITVQNGYFADMDGNTLTIDASGISNTVQVNGASLGAANGMNVLASNGSSTLRGGAGEDSLSFAGQTAGLDIDLNNDTATQGATTYTFSGFESITGSAHSDTLRGSLADEALNGGAGDDHIYTGTASSDFAFSNLVLHLDATDGSTLTTATGISQWADKSGRGNNATQGTASNQPTATGSSIAFDGSNDYFAVGDTNDINLSSQSERSVFVQFETGADVTSRQVIYEQGGGSNGFGIYIVGGNVYVGAWKSSGSNFGLFESGAVTANTKYSAGFVFDFPNGEFRGYLNGNLLGTQVVTQDQGGHSGDIGIGALNNASYFHDIGADNGSLSHFFQGNISELLNYSYALTSAESDSLSDYLATKYDSGGNGDTLTGGEGADTFYWEDANTSTSSAADRITDFSMSEGDRIDLTDTASQQFVISGNAALSGITGEIAWQQEGANTRVQLDRDGDGAADLEILLENYTATALDEDAFVLPALSLEGSAYADTLSGANDDDTLSGGFGDDVIYGEDGNDAIYGGVSGSYTPNDGAFWLDASNAGSLTLSSGVQRIDDLFGTNDASQSTAGARPQLQSGGLNGLDTMRFDGTNDILVMSSAADINTSNQSERSVFITFETGANVTARQYLYEQGGSTNGFSVYIYNGEIYVAAWRANGGDFGHYLHTSIDPNTAYTVGFVFDYGGTNSFTAYLNGSSYDSAAIAMEQAAHSDAMGIGGVNGGTRHESGSGSGSYFNGEIAEIINYDRALDTAERQSLEAHLSEKWGTPFLGSVSDDDSLIGGAGNDTLTGGSGQDTMTGGEGEDVFAFLDTLDSTTANPDYITDFVRGEDKLDVSALGYTAASDFTITQSGGVTTVDDGAGFTIQLNGALALSDSDFIF